MLQIQPTFALAIHLECLSDRDVIMMFIFISVENLSMKRMNKLNKIYEIMTFSGDLVLTLS